MLGLHIASIDEIFINRTDDSVVPVDHNTLGYLNDGDATHNVPGSSPSEDRATQSRVSIERSTVLCQQSNNPGAFVVNRSNVYSNNKNWSYVIDMFPTLFAGGCGGPAQPRVHELPLRKWIQRCLSLHRNRFEQHYGFMLMAFNCLARQASQRSLYYQLRVNREALTAGQVNDAVIRQCLEYQDKLAAARKLGVKDPEPPGDVRRVLNLRKGIVSGEAAFYGSSAERSNARHKLFGFVRRLGMFQLFLTLSPDSAGTYVIGINSGNIDPNIVTESNHAILPTRPERKAFASKNPVQSAKYFMRVMNTFITKVLGWDIDACAPLRVGGVFGKVRAFFGATETQIGGDLHAHFIIWLFGFPRTANELRKKIKHDPTFATKLAQYADRIAVMDVPISTDDSCPVSGCDGHLKASPIPGEAFKRPLPGQRPVVTATCSECATDFRDKDVMNLRLDTACDETGVLASRDFIDYVKCSPPCQPFEDNLRSRTLVSLVMRDVQVHFWTHCSSCFKLSATHCKSRLEIVIVY